MKFSKMEIDDEIPIMISVTAPSNMEEGFNFEAYVNGDKNRSFTCVVVRKNHRSVKRKDCSRSLHSHSTRSFPYRCFSLQEESRKARPLWFPFPNRRSRKIASKPPRESGKMVFATAVPTDPVIMHCCWPFGAPFLLSARSCSACPSLGGEISAMPRVPL